MKNDCLANFLFDFLASGACRYAAWEIRQIGGKTCRCRLNHSQTLFHGPSTSQLLLANRATNRTVEIVTNSKNTTSPGTNAAEFSRGGLCKFA